MSSIRKFIITTCAMTSLVIASSISSSTLSSIAPMQQLDSQDAEKILQCWNTLSSEEQTQLMNQIQDLDLDLLKRQKELVQHPTFDHTNKPIEPFLDFEYAGNKQDKKEGIKKIQEGQLGCLVLAGGQGSRLNFNYPKGMYPISVIKNKSLFQLIAEKVLAAGKLAQRPLYLAIMTSPLNDRETKDFFIRNHFFGLQPDQVSFFQQGMLPFLDAKGNLFLESPDTLALGPNGNGLCLKEFVKAGIWSEWKAKGIRYIHMIPIDNPLADPFDAEFLSFHIRQNVDISAKSVEKVDPNEKVGIFIRESGHPRVIEYSELEDHYKVARDPEERLKYRCANLGLFCFSMDFIEYVAKQENMPLHKAWKAAKYLDQIGQIHTPTQPNAWKFETFIFDVLNYTDRMAALFYQRDRVFAPLKNATGDNSPQTVKKALQERDRQILKQLTGLEPPQASFELAAEFYYPTPDLVNRWKGKLISDNGGYITSRMMNHREEM